ncbi:MAG: glycoside hydrolase family 98 domain-containing protein [Microthrixaceae bacterium]
MAPHPTSRPRSGCARRDGGGGARGSSVVAVALMVVASLLGGCSGNDAGERAGAARDRSPDVVVPRIALPRYTDDGPVRLTMSATRPLFLYNVYVGDGPKVVDEVVARWPKDLQGYLGFQIVFPAHDKTPETERAAVLDSFLARTDAARIPAIVQTAVFTGVTGPTAAELDRSFTAHPSLVGVGIAEFSVDVQTVVSGLSDAQKDLIVDNIGTAVRNHGLFLWADMGYLGPQVFVNAGADERIHTLMSEHPENIVVQVKQNGAGSRFTSMSAAFGFYVAGVAANWGINSEDWIWYEASLERLYGPQVPGGMTAAGMVRSPYVNRARRTYPEALFGTEMLVAASAGATVFSIETPERGTVDPKIEGESPAGPNVVFPVLRRLIAERLIPDRATVLGRTHVAYQPRSGAPGALTSDLAFSGLYGPEGCTDADRLSCAQRQWLPSTGRYGLIPVLPALTAPDVAKRFDAVVEPIEGSDGQRRAIVDPLVPAPAAHGTSWIAPAGPTGTWFVANPNENRDVTSDATIPLGRGVELHGVFGPHTFAMVDARTGVSVLVDNFRTDSDRLWDDAPTEDQLARIGLDDVGAAPPAETVLVFSLPDGVRRTLRHEGGEVREAWDSTAHRLTVTVRHRGPVTLELG